MTDYRLISEGVRVAEVGDRNLPIRTELPIWHGDYIPGVDELKDIILNLPGIDEQARATELSRREEAKTSLEAIVGHEINLPMTWPVHLQEKRFIGFLGHKTLGTVNKDRLFLDDDFQLDTYWRHKKREGEKSPELKAAERGMLKLSLGIAAVGAAEIWYFTKGMK